MRTIQNAYPERQLAKERGDQWYFTGRPCKNGHISKRRVLDASCQQCREDAKVSWHREWLKNHMRKKRASFAPDKREAERARGRSYSRKRRIEKYEEVIVLERKHSRLKRLRHPERKNADTRKRQAQLIQRLPTWANTEAIRAFYEDCPEGHEVDHIAPLRGKTVSGLHVISNLQYLPIQENRRKQSQFDAEEYSIAELGLWQRRQRILGASI